MPVRLVVQYWHLLMWLPGPAIPGSSLDFVNETAVVELPSLVFAILGSAAGLLLNPPCGQVQTSPA